VIVGSLDLVTKGLCSGPVAGQRQLEVRVIDRIAHWLPEQRPELVAEWVLSG